MLDDRPTRSVPVHKWIACRIPSAQSRSGAPSRGVPSITSCAALLGRRLAPEPPMRHRLSMFSLLLRALTVVGIVACGSSGGAQVAREDAGSDSSAPSGADAGDAGLPLLEGGPLPGPTPTGSNGYGCMPMVNGCFCSNPPGPGYNRPISDCIPYSCCYRQTHDGRDYCQCQAAAAGCPDVSTMTKVARCPP